MKKKWTKYVVIAIILFLFWNSCFPHKFNSEKWRDKNHRSLMYADLVHNAHLSKKSKSEIRVLLGDPNGESNNEFTYTIPINYFGVMEWSYFLNIYFEKDTVTQFSITD